MDDLISRKVARAAVYGYEMQTGIAEMPLEFAHNKIDEVPSVPAVPLDKLCEWLAKFANPCKIGIRCYYDNDRDCMPTVECWRYVLKKWMEETKE